jgi:2'-5' RNA ligase
MTTIGVAIAVPEPWAGELQRQRASFGDPLAEAIPTHVTLVPPTSVDGRLATVEDHLADVATRIHRFRIHLRGTATFRPVSPVVFVALAEGISSCEVLATKVRQGPLAQQLHYPYHPHVTVAHDLDDAALDKAFETLADFDCAFPVTGFHLFVHGPDGIWRPHRSFSLAKDVPGPHPR